MIATSTKNLNRSCRVCHVRAKQVEKGILCHTCSYRMTPFLCNKHRIITIYCEKCTLKYIRFFPNAQYQKDILFYYTKKK